MAQGPNAKGTSDKLNIGSKSAPQTLGDSREPRARKVITTVNLHPRATDDFAVSQPRNGAGISTTGGK